jgi:hypothetical protein
MKVYIGKYRNWWGPYQIAGLIPFISEDTAHDIGNWLCEHTPLEKICNSIDKLRGGRTIKVRIDPYDTWSMDNTLAHIILPMLKQLKETKHGSPYVDDEDVPPHMRHSDCRDCDGNPSEWGGDNWVHYKWEWVLNEMIWAFEQELDDSWEEQFHHGESKVDWNIVSGEEGSEHAVYEMKQTNPDYWVDFEGMKCYSDRIQNGFRLFGKYYQGLWD